MKETLRHKEAFEQYYVMGNDRSLAKLMSVKCPYGVRKLKTYERWSKAFNWQERVEQRDIEIGRELPAKTNETVLDIKANYRAEIKAQFSILKKMLNELIGKFKEDESKDNKGKDKKGIEIKDVTGLKDVLGCYEKLIRMDLTLIGEVSEREEIALRDAEEKFFNEINSLVAREKKAKGLKRNKRSKR